MAIRPIAKLKSVVVTGVSRLFTLLTQVRPPAERGHTLVGPLALTQTNFPATV